MPRRPPSRKVQFVERLPTKAMRIAMKAAYRAFLAAYRFAADQLRAGNRAAVFPRGCFPPALPAVRGVALAPG